MLTRTKKPFVHSVPKDKRHDGKTDSFFACLLRAAAVLPFKQSIRAVFGNMVILPYYRQSVKGDL
jgi:hypothetical protein